MKLFGKYINFDALPRHAAAAAAREKKKKEKKNKPTPKWVKKLAAISEGKVLGNAFVQAGIIAILNILYIEGFGYGNAFGGFEFFAKNPYAFLVNTLMVFATLSPAWLFRRRIFVYTAVSMWWVLFGTVNGVVLQFRMTPFTTADIQIIGMGLDILPNYLSTGQIAASVAGILAFLLILVLIFIFAPRHRKKVEYRKAAACVLISVAMCAGSLPLGIHTGMLDEYFENLWDAYTRNGAPYCFFSTWLNKGIDRPVGYSEANIKAIVEEDSQTETAGQETPNFVFLQLESFVDPDELTQYEYSGVATPWFKELKQNYSSGHLNVPVVGGGTANTEFEVMSGMSVWYFGPGEYPYKSVLMDETCETFAYDLKKLGYATHAIHNHRGAFYNRNEVFANLGFDDFTSLEYMNYVSKTPKNYAKDDVLVGEILGALGSTSEKDYIYCISVQGHGEYPKTKLIPDPKIRVLDPDSNIPQEAKNAYEYYLTEVGEMDEFIRELTTELSKYEEPTVLILYGDHLPALGMTAEETKTGSAFETEYVIWANFEMEKQDKDLSAFQLAAEVQRRVGMKEGTIFSFHQTQDETPDYAWKLQMLQYDMLYGKKYVYDGLSPFQPTNLKMGYNPIKIESIRQIGTDYYIIGTGFTPYSKVSLDGDILGTVYLGPTLLKLDKRIDPAEAVNMKVSQVEKYDEILSTTE
ncbi:MAG: sulfatase-like hydrolase/transferase [Clostridiales Family XIII bacterium]|jgi:phosphoglycerol transferase MdoB-like AlkP superfamily enzyme|nr:sulfatase-like hydrolase/transferase [Clostridiales Family XIII bacterium]